MKRMREEKGQTQLEYILLISVVIVILSMGIPPMRDAVANVITRAIAAFSRNDEQHNQLLMEEFLDLILSSIYPKQSLITSTRDTLWCKYL
jgi:hypothetical protein